MSACTGGRPHDAARRFTHAGDRAHPVDAGGQQADEGTRAHSAAKKARDLGSRDVIADAFMQLAIDVNLIDQAGRWTGADVRESTRQFGAEDISHLITWALRGWNPFEKGPLT
jgi:hypothetical protein